MANNRKERKKAASNMYRGSDFGDEQSQMSSYNPVVDDYYRARRFSRRNKAIRIIFVLCAMLYAIFSILAVTKGVTNLQNTINTLNKNAENIDAVSAEARDIINSGLRETAELAQSVRATLRVQLNAETFCPSDPSFSESDAGKQVFDQAQEAIRLLEALDDFKVVPVFRTQQPVVRGKGGLDQCITGRNRGVVDQRAVGIDVIEPDRLFDVVRDR